MRRPNATPIYQFTSLATLIANSHEFTNNNILVNSYVIRRLASPLMSFVD